MSWKTYRVRNVLVPRSIEEARGRAAEVMGVPLPDLRKLKPIFNETLAIEVVAFILTGLAAIVDFMVG